MKKWLPIVLVGFGIFCLILSVVFIATSLKKRGLKNCNETSDGDVGEKCTAYDPSADVCYDGTLYMTDLGQTACKIKFYDFAAILDIIGFVSLIAGFICVILRP